MTMLTTLSKIQRTRVHQNTYNQLAEEYKRKCQNKAIQQELWQKAMKCKQYCDTPHPKGLEIGVGA